ncbi:MAG: AAA family ATPase, partial [Bacillota bacterium]
GKTKVVAIYSPIGGCGKSLISIALSRKLKKLDQKVLLAGCDDLQSFSVFFDQIEYADDELAKELREVDDNTYWTILRNIGIHEFSYLKPFERVPHAVGVGRTQFSSFLDLMKQKKDFDFIILDIGSRVDEAGVTLMEKADEIVLVTEPTVLAMKKMARIAGDQAMLPQKKCVLISDQYHSDGLRYGEDAIFDSLPAYIDWKEAMEDPMFYRLALSVLEEK